MIKIEISKTLQGKIRNGYPWVFKYQVQNKIPEGKQEYLGVIYDHKNRFLAVGLWDPFSDLCFRVLNLGEPKEISREFFQKRLQAAIKIREDLKSQATTGYRVINGENDRFPGLVLDRYEDTLVLKLYTASWFPFLDELCELFQKEFKSQQVVLRLSRNVDKFSNDDSIYRDGQVLYGEGKSGWVQFKENGLNFIADVIEGQKTGFYLDQKDNRLRIREMSKGLSVLNVFSYSGGFSVYALAGGCNSIVEVDYNPFALKTSLRNLKLNFPEKTFPSENFIQRKGDAFQILAQLKSEKCYFDLVILDPPAFARKKKHKASALDAYTSLAKAGAQLTSGVLYAASCSAHVPEKEFYDAVNLGIRSAGKKFKEIARTGHAQDHPATFPEAFYLKSAYIKIGL
ncbi:MAG: class I SAM-dependent rRNA methyltransferase [Nitrospina sp.]|jgi:23S rRNA (cytosine1962-C5)-methyltransferase|nr:class I SAM-dependent rRNA methyltransferase [Nitrospina sp.]MBT3508434.1 class I SAM-dependent rRNA methyltransferase [Nitrospina sp.]MBT3876983.1 class I SAM-dependent rRNA methyltransferase [Nitrospina sp.]MBT4048822.1 class I SAM-dependent rRNA methyltransferase [Nitrospina sp.]MBT4556126.1 class I SAM-dependent rRNA methyltransferase [Nitrospina sp.]